MSNYDFKFQTVPYIHTQWDGFASFAEEIKNRFDYKKILLISDSGLVKLGLLNDFIEGCHKRGIEVTLFDKVIADPPEHIVLKATQTAKSVSADAVIAVGGGSSLDVAKLVAILANNEQPLEKMYGIDQVEGSRLPLILVPTTAGTGSEVTNISIITTGKTTKMGVVSSQLYADYVLLDAKLTVGLPVIHTAATGIDAMVHAIEAYTSKHKKNALSDALAIQALQLLSTNLLAACEDGHNQEAREKMLLGSMLAGQAFSNSPVAAVHALAYPLGGHYHITHGLSNALMLIPVLEFNAQNEQAKKLYAELAPHIGAKSASSDHFIERIKELMQQSGAPQTLKEVGVKEDFLPTLASDAMLQTRLLQNNPVEVSEQDALKLYQTAF